MFENYNVTFFVRQYPSPPLQMSQGNTDPASEFLSFSAQKPRFAICFYFFLQKNENFFFRNLYTAYICIVKVFYLFKF